MQNRPAIMTITRKAVFLAIPRKWTLNDPRNFAQGESSSCGWTRGAATGLGSRCSSGSSAWLFVRLSAKLKREYAKAKTTHPTPIQSKRFHSSKPLRLAERVFLSATVQYLVTALSVATPKGSSRDTRLCRCESWRSAKVTARIVNRRITATNEAISLRHTTATANMIAAVRKVSGRAKSRMLFKWAVQFTACHRSASAQGMYFASRMPSEIPSMGIAEIRVAPKNRPSRRSRRRMGVENIIW